MNSESPAPLRTRLIQTALPLLSSLAVHVAVVAVGVATAGAIVGRSRVLQEEQVGAATSQVPTAKAGDDVTRAAECSKASPLALMQNLAESDPAAVPQAVA